MARLTALLIASCLASANCNAQIESMIDSNLYHGRVKLVWEFMQRFNGEELHPSVKPSDQDAERANLLQLFDYEKIASNAPVNESSALQLVDSISSNAVKLHFYDKEWYATARCVGHLKEKEVKFDLLLTVEPRGDNMYKWVISDVSGEIFHLKPSRYSETIMLLPNEHESDFMKLNSITAEKDDYITLYTSKTNPVNRLSVFNTLVYYDVLNIDYVSDIEYTFMQVPGYTFTIHEIERESTNAGWLITSWNKISQEDKNLRLDALYHGHYAQSDSASHKNVVRTPIPTKTPQEAIKKVESFIACLNNFINKKDPDSLDDLENSVKGRYHFIISDDISDYLVKFYGLKTSESYFIESLTNCMIRNDFPFQSITVSNLQEFVNNDIKSRYANGFSLISGEMTADGKGTKISENVVFFVYDNQIAGIKRISDCF
jgi:hypothetical protein